MLHASTQQLIRKLCELTETGAITWNEGDAGASVFETEGYLVEIRAEPATVRLLRADGRELERADAADLALPWPEGQGTYASNVSDMARRADRIARGAETAIAKILSSLSAPPKKQVEPEPAPAAIAFEPAPSLESAAAIAAVSADLESQRRKAAEEPPVSHSLPEPAPMLLVLAETETAIDRVLAVQSEARIEETPPPAVEETEAWSEQTADAAAPPEASLPELPPEREPARAPSALAAIDIAPPAAAIAEPAASAPGAAASPRLAFGAIGGFARAQTTSKPAPSEPGPEMSKLTSTGLLVRGFSARSRQTAEAATTKDIFRPAVAASPLQSQPTEKQLEPAAGADIYKPWS